MVWEVVFMMVILKIPIVYLAAVVYWAIKAEPKPLEGAALAVRDRPGPRFDPAGARQPRLRGPIRSAPRGGLRASRAAAPVRARARR